MTSFKPMSGLPRKLRPFTASCRGPFKGVGTDATQMGMAAGTIVEDLDVIEDIRATQLAGLIDAFADTFFLQAAEERLRDSIVPAVTPSAHTGLQPMRKAEALPIIIAVL